MLDDNEYELAERAQRGDAAAEAVLMDRLAPEAVRMAVWVCPWGDDEDVIQDGLIGALQAIRTFRRVERATLNTWTFTKVRAAVQHGTAFRQSSALRPPEDFRTEPPEPPTTPEDDVYRVELRVRVERLVRGCSEMDATDHIVYRTRLCVDGEPLSQREVAVLYGIPKSTVALREARLQTQVLPKLLAELK